MSLVGEGGEGVVRTHENLRTELMVFAGIMAGVSDGRIRVAVSEEDTTTDTQLEVAHF